MQGQNNTFSYYSYPDKYGFSKEIILTLNSNNSFAYKFIDDQVCYEDIYVSFGNWEQKGDSIKLYVADSLKAKVFFIEKTLKKDTLTIFFKRTNEKSLLNDNEYYYDSGGTEFHGLRQLFFYNEKNDKIKISYKYKGILEIPQNKNIKRIEMYIPNTKHKDNYLEIKIPKNTGQIFIKNLSRYLITNFERYSFLKKNNTIIMKYPWGKYKLMIKN